MGEIKLRTLEKDGRTVIVGNDKTLKSFLSKGWKEVKKDDDKKGNE